MTDDEFVQRVRDRGRLLGLTLAPDTIWTILDDALAELSEQASNGRYPLLQKDFTVAMVSGTADMSAITDPLMSSTLVKSIRNVRGADGTEWQREQSRAGLKREKHALNRIWYAIVDNSLYAMRDDGLTAADDQTITFNAHYCPVVTAVPSELENELIDIGLSYAMAPSPSTEVDGV